MADKTKKLIDEIGDLTVVELAELVKALEDKFGVTAAAPQVAAAVSAPAAAGAVDEPKEEQVAFTVVLTNAGANKISVIKALREINGTLGLKEAKDLAESAPKNVLEGVNKATADEAVKKLKDAGATVESK